MKADLAAVKAQDVPSKSTGSKKAKTVGTKESGSTTGRLQDLEKPTNGTYASCEISLFDARARLNASGRCDCGSD